MNTIFIIEDELHSEKQGEYNSFEDAVNELKKRVNIPWNISPNRAPCISWETCGRKYVIIEYNTKITPWKKVNEQLVLKISAKATKWVLK